METKQLTYLTDYRSLKMTRDAQGVLVAEFHTNGGPLTFTARDHTDFVDAFYRIAQDRANKIVILTGTGGEFTPWLGFSSPWKCPYPRARSAVPFPSVEKSIPGMNIRVP